MNDIVFSSWGGRTIDNRGKAPEDYEPVDHAPLPEYFKKDQKIKALIGWNGIVLRSTDVDILHLCKAYLEAVYDHSKTCDKCNYCTTGWEEQIEVFQDIFDGEATEEDLEFLGSTSEAIMEAGKCTIGKAGPTPLFHALKYFNEDFLQAISGKQSQETGTYYSKLTAPCIDACPIHLDIPKYVELIKDTKFAESLQVIRERLPLAGVLGRACYHPCEQNCRRANVDEAISIRQLKRFVADNELSENSTPDFPVSPDKKTGKVAIIGGGPAGLTCAFHLAQRGHKVTIFEKLPVSGGMISVGIPNYRVLNDVVDEEIKFIKDMGVVIKNGIEVGKDISTEQLREEGYEAIFISIGTQECKTLGIEGEDLKGVYPGLDFLREVGLGKNTGIDPGDRIAVIGGGNVAMDAVRTAKRLGAEPFILYRRDIAEMPAHEEELGQCKEEGIQIQTLTNPVRIIGENGKIKAIECVKMSLDEPDESGRPRPVPVENSEFSIEVDGIIPAIGQESDYACLGPECACTLSGWGTINADSNTTQTDDPHIFAGGDAVTGPLSLVDAAASGRKAAMSIARYINDLPVEPSKDDYFNDLFKSIKVYDPDEEIRRKIEPSDRKRPTFQPPESRMSNFDEVEHGYSTPNAVSEAERCLRCYRVVTIAVEA